MKRVVSHVNVSASTESEVAAIDRPGLESYIDSNH
jgi:hypothetical protein